MDQISYNVFLSRNGSYAALQSRHGVIAHASGDFECEADAIAWIARQRSLTRQHEIAIEQGDGQRGRETIPTTGLAGARSAP